MILNVSEKNIVRPRVGFRLNAKIQIHGDRRTKRGRDRSTKNRQAIRRSEDDQ